MWFPCSRWSRSGSRDGRGRTLAGRQLGKQISGHGSHLWVKASPVDPHPVEDHRQLAGQRNARLPEARSPADGGILSGDFDAVQHEGAANVAQAAAAAEVVVLKFGSSILRSPAEAPLVAAAVYGYVRAGRKVVAVVSAFGGSTDRLLGEARALGLPHSNELLPGYVALGEEKSAALVAIACDRIGLEACALSVRELGIVAQGEPEHSRPSGLRPDHLKQALDRHEVVVVPGFGAVKPDGRVALLGRGGSDLTAVFLAAELGLKKVRLVKD
ncbi:hypothetical protein LTR94_026803, partial [Friedmanniomyces endolithicus]